MTQRACYRDIILGAQEMGREDAAALLQKNLQQEEKTVRFIEKLAPQLLQRARQ
ncbi:MAG TPA: DUF892 family protein [Abditibacterium sp.]|jgi:ferritin-like metal-binding protein YciE